MVCAGEGSQLTEWPTSAAQPYLRQLAAIGVDDVHAAPHTGVERVDGTQDLKRLLGIGNRSTDQGRFVRTWLALDIARRCVPGGSQPMLPCFLQ